MKEKSEKRKNGTQADSNTVTHQKNNPELTRCIIPTKLQRTMMVPYLLLYVAHTVEPTSRSLLNRETSSISCSSLHIIFVIQSFPRGYSKLASVSHHNAMLTVRPCGRFPLDESCRIRECSSRTLPNEELGMRWSWYGDKVGRCLLSHLAILSA